MSPGEVFALLLIETDLEKAGGIAQRLLAAQEKADVDGQVVTVSIGVAELSPNDEDFQALADRADDALYKAKRGGRNQLHIHS